MVRRGMAPVACALALAAAGCATNEAWAPLDLDELPGKEKYPEDKAVVLLDETTIRYDLDEDTGEPYAEVTRNHRARVLTEGGRGVAYVGTEYRPGLIELVDFQARVVSPPEEPAEGEERPEPDEKTYGRADALDAPLVGYALYSDARRLELRPRVVPVAGVVESRTVHRYKDLRMFSQWHFFGGHYPEAESRLTVSVPKGWRIDYLARRLGEKLDWAPTKRDEGGRTIYEWVRKEIPRTPDETLRPEWRLAHPSVMVRLASWTVDGKTVENLADPVAVSAYQHSLQKDKAKPDAAIEKTVAEILAGAEGAAPREKARRLYDWVRRNVRYCALEIGMGGWVPHEAEKVHEVRYGDCKDKATLLQSMLAVAGIPSRVATIYSHDGFPVPYGLPTVVGNSNHAILVIDLPSGPVFADPTDRAVPFGALPYRDQEADVLPASAEGSPLMKTPATTPDQNVERLEVELKLDGGGDAEGTFTASALGTLADGRRSQLVAENREDRRRTVDAWVDLEQGEVTKVEALETVEPVDVETPLTARGTVRAESLLADAGGHRIVRFSDLLDRLVPVLPAESRELPVVLGSRRRYVHQVKLVLPAGLSVASLPAAAEVETKYGRFALAWRSEPGAIVAERTLELRAPVVPAAEYEALRSFFEEIEAAEEAPALLRAEGGGA